MDKTSIVLADGEKQYDVAATSPAQHRREALIPLNSDGSKVRVESTAVGGTQDVNVKQINGNTVDVGNGTAGSGTIRVAVASDSFPATQAVSIANGADVAEGSTTDAAVTTNTTGTISGKLRGIVALLAQSLATLGQKVMSGSMPVVIASDQTAIPISSSSDSVSLSSSSPTDYTTNGRKFAFITIRFLSAGSVTFYLRHSLSGNQMVAPVVYVADSNGTLKIANTPTVIMQDSGGNPGLFLVPLFGSPKLRVEFNSGSLSTGGIIFSDNESLPIDPAGIVDDSNNSRSTTLTAGSTFTGIATNVLPHSQINLELFARPSTVQGDGTNARASLFFEFSPDGTNWDISVPILVRDPGLFIPYPIISVSAFFRVRYLNDGGSAAVMALGLPSSEATTAQNQTSFRLNSYLLPKATKELARTLDQSVSGSDPVSLARSVIMGKTTDLTYKNFRADGIVSGNSSTTPLTASATFTGAWFDTDGYAGFAVLVKSDKVSATNGLQIQFSPDNGTTIVDTIFLTYSSASLNDGIRESGALSARYIRVVYQNGGTNQTNFYISTSLTVTPVQSPLTTVEQQETGSDIVSVGKNAIFAQDPSATTYQNITRSTTDGSSRTGLHVAIQKHEVETPLKALAGLSITRTSMTTTAAKVVATPRTNRRSIGIKAICSGSALVYLGTSNSVTSGNGYPLSDGQSIDMELDDSVTEIWGIASTGTQAISVVEVST